MPDKKSALSRPTAKAAAKAAPAKKAPPARREPAAKKAPAPVKAAKAPAKAPAPKAAAKAPTKAAPAPKPAPAAKAAAPKPAPAAKTTAAKVEPKAKAPAANATKAVAKPIPEPKKPVTKGKPLPVASKAATKDAAQVKAEKPAKVEKPPKREKPPKAEKPPKPPKLAPVAAALAKPMPAKPLAVAAGRAQPIARTPVTPLRVVPKPLVAPKPVIEPETVGESKAVPAFKGKISSAKGMVIVGAIAGAFGVKGEVRLRAFTATKEGVISYGPLYGADGKVVLRPKTWRALKDGVAVMAPEVKTKEQADKMKRLKLFVPRANLPAAEDDEFYFVDLLGCRAESLDGQVLGDIVAVWNFGAGDIIEYRPPNGGPNVRVLFNKETVPLVDLPGKRVVLDPPEPEPLGK